MQALLHVSGQLAAASRDVKHVEGAMRFGVDQHHFDITTVPAEGGCKIIQKAWPILGDKVDEG